MTKRADERVVAVSPWHAERGCVPGGFCRVWGRRHQRTRAGNNDAQPPREGA